MSKESDRHTLSSEGEHLESASFDVPEMDCPSCAEKITKSVTSLTGIETVEPRVMSGNVTVGYNSKNTSQAAIADRIEAAGYTVRSNEEPDSASFSVPEMDCPSCAGKITSSIEQLSGIRTVEPEVTSGSVHVEYDSSKTRAEQIHERIEAAGYSVETRQNERTATFDVPEMDCASCAGKIDNALEARDGIRSFETQPTTGTVTVTYDPDQLPQPRIIGLC